MPLLKRPTTLHTFENVITIKHKVLAKIYNLGKAVEKQHQQNKRKHCKNKSKQIIHTSNQYTNILNDIIIDMNTDLEFCYKKLNQNNLLKFSNYKAIIFPQTDNTGYYLHEE